MQPTEVMGDTVLVRQTNLSVVLSVVGDRNNKFLAKYLLTNFLASTLSHSDWIDCRGVSPAVLHCRGVSFTAGQHYVTKIVKKQSQIRIMHFWEHHA